MPDIRNCFHRPQLTSLPASLLLIVVSLTASGQEVPADSSSRQTGSQIEQITITSKRTPFQLRARIKAAERRLYSAYNEVNTEDDYDVDCDKDTPTMSHIPEQRCWPVFFQNIVADEAQRAMLLQDFNIVSPDKLAVLYATEFDKLRANILAVAKENPEVASALMEYGGLQQALKETMEICRQGERLLFLFYRCAQTVE